MVSGRTPDRPSHVAAVRRRSCGVKCSRPDHSRSRAELCDSQVSRLPSAREASTHSVEPVSGRRASITARACGDRGTRWARLVFVSSAGRFHHHAPGVALKIPPAHGEHLSGPLGRQEDQTPRGGDRGL